VAKAKERNRHFFLNFLFNHFEERLNAPRLIGLLTKLALFYNWNILSATVMRNWLPSIAQCIMVSWLLVMESLTRMAVVQQR